MSAIGALVGTCFEVRARMARALGGGDAALDPSALQLARDGIALLRDRIPMDVVGEINRLNAPLFAATDRSELIYSPDGKALAEGAAATDDELNRYYFLHIRSYQARIDVYRDLMPYLEPVLGAYYRSNYYVRDIYCYRTQPIEEVAGSYLWHVDNYPSGSLKVMIYLTGVGEDDGPFAFARRSHEGFRPRLGRIGERFEDSWVRSRYEVVECLGGPGTTIIFNNNGIHRAVTPRTGTRDVVNFTVFPRVRRGRPAVRGLDLRSEAGFLKRYTR